MSCSKKFPHIWRAAISGAYLRASESHYNQKYHYWFQWGLSWPHQNGHKWGIPNITATQSLMNQKTTKKAQYNTSVDHHSIGIVYLAIAVTQYNFHLQKTDTFTSSIDIVFSTHLWCVLFDKVLSFELLGITNRWFCYSHHSNWSVDTVRCCLLFPPGGLSLLQGIDLLLQLSESHYIILMVKLILFMPLLILYAKIRATDAVLCVLLMTSVLVWGWTGLYTL